MKSSRKRGGKSRFDRISSLPDELIGNILSNLPTRCAVSTSILSKRWRYLFTLTDCLSFDDAPCFVLTKGEKKIVPAQKQRFKEFVYRVLQLHQISPIKKFSLMSQGTCEISDLNAWVSNVIQKGVQELHYSTVSKLHSRLPDEVLMCETLVRLKLTGFRHSYGDNIKTPLSTSLPSLKILHLVHVTFFELFSLQQLLSSSKLLEELTLDSCVSNRSGRAIISTRLLQVLAIQNCYFQNGCFEIDAPNLAYLTYNCNFGVKIVPSWKYSCSLVKAELKFRWSAYAFNSYSNGYDGEILKIAAYKTTKLYLSSDSVEFLPKFVDQEQMPDFHSLSKLHLCYFRCHSWKYVTNLLDKSPQLDTLIFGKGLVRCTLWPVSSDALNETLLPFSCHAQVIEVHRFCGRKVSLLLLEHLLRNARFLKKLIVHRCRCSNTKKKKVHKDLIMKLPRASSNCCIELK